MNVIVLFKGAICENWPPVELILETNRGGNYVTGVTTNCCLLLWQLAG